jgi:Ion channel
MILRRLIQKARKYVRQWRGMPAEARKKTYFRGRDLWVTICLPIFVIVSLAVVWPHVDTRATGTLPVIINVCVVLVFVGLAVILTYAHPRSVLRLCLFPLMAGVVFVIFFSWTYWDYSAQPGSCMNVALTKTDSIYFTLTTLTTVGYGDIVPVTEHCRMIVSAQMAGGLIFGAVLLALLVARIAARAAR